MLSVANEYDMPSVIRSTDWEICSLFRRALFPLLNRIAAKLRSTTHYHHKGREDYSLARISLRQRPSKFTPSYVLFAYTKLYHSSDTSVKPWSQILS